MASSSSSSLAKKSATKARLDMKKLLRLRSEDTPEETKAVVPSSSKGKSVAEPTTPDIKPSTRKRKAEDDSESQSPRTSSRLAKKIAGAEVSGSSVHKDTLLSTPSKKIGKRAVSVEKKEAEPTETATATDEDEDDEGEIEDDDGENEAQDDVVNGSGAGEASVRIQATADEKLESSGFGYSKQKPLGIGVKEKHKLQAPWNCGNRSCVTGQSWFDRNVYGRKVISNFFGRNKKATKRIPDDVWHTFCRKDYQTGTYAARKSPKSNCDYYIENIRDQLLRLQLCRPFAKFEIKLAKGAKDRLTKYYEIVAKQKGDTTGAAEAVTKKPKKNKKDKELPLSLEDAIPFEYILILDDFCKLDQSYDDIYAVMIWTEHLVNAGKITSMPPYEFLINDDVEGEPKIDAALNYQLWCDVTAGRKTIEQCVREHAKYPDETHVYDRVEEAGEDLLEGAEDGNDEMEDDDEEESTELTTPNTPVSPIPPPRFKLKLTDPRGPAATTYDTQHGSGIKYKRAREEDSDEEGERSTYAPPSKKLKVSEEGKKDDADPFAAASVKESGVVESIEPTS